MKAYLLRNRKPLPPFKKPASDVRLRGCTLHSRLQTQLAKARLEVAEVDELDVAGIEPGSLVVQNDVVVSDNFFSRFLAAIPDRKRNYQCEMEVSRYSLMSTSDVTEVFRKLPITFYGAPDAASASNAVDALRMVPESIHTVADGMPARVHEFTGVRAHFLDLFAVHVEYWFDLQTATGLYTREFVVSLLKPAYALLPHWLFQRVLRTPWIMERGNSIGKNCQIHPTAILEGCVVGDDVSIGPYAYLRATVVGDGAVLRERTASKMSYLGERSFIMGSDVVNCYVGAESAIITPMLYNLVFGERSFVSGGSGFADFIFGAGHVLASIEGKDVPSHLRFLGSAVGDNCFIGANLLFAPGRTIPDGTTLLDNGLIKAVPTAFDGAFVLSGTHLLQIPNGFVGKQRP